METILPEIIFELEYFNNTLWEYLVFLGSFLLLSLVFFLLKFFIFRRIYKVVSPEKKIFRVLVEVMEKIRSPFYVFIAFYLSLSFIDIPEFLSSIFWIILVLWVTYRVVVVVHQFLDFGLRTYLKRTEEEDEAMIRNLGNIGKAIVWIFAVLFVLSVFGIDITALVAGMGIGGIAVAFALQSILSDLFSSFSIFLDKPFTEGDFIIVGDKWGTVEKIGIKSTRVRALQGEEVVFSNKELTTAQVRNFGEMEYWRADFQIGIIYETETEKMKKIPEMVQDIVNNEEDVEFERMNFVNFGDFSLDHRLVYYVKNPSYREFLDINERILLNIKQKFEEEGIEFAYPTETVHFYSKDKE